jgi:hypothetical protein
VLYRAVINASERTDQRAAWPAVGNFKMAPKMNQPVPSLLSSTPASRSRTRTDGSFDEAVGKRAACAAHARDDEVEVEVEVIIW